jgi:hypothetical protein
MKCRNCNKWVAVLTWRRKLNPEPEEISNTDTVLKAGDMPELERVIADLEITINRTRNAMGAMDKVTEFENLRKAYDALKRAEQVLTPIMFKFVE